MISIPIILMLLGLYCLASLKSLEGLLGALAFVILGGLFW
jgi:hypothetical protein